MPVTFGPFVLDRGARQLLRGVEERRLGPKGFELLLLLLDQRPNVVPRERIRERLWPGTFISESTLATLVSGGISAYLTWWPSDAAPAGAGLGPLPIGLGVGVSGQF